MLEVSDAGDRTPMNCEQILHAGTTIAASTAIALGSFLFASPARANCNDRVGELEYFQPAMARRWAELQARETYPWGRDRIYDRIAGNSIFLTEKFDRLSGPQKQQAIDLLLLDYGDTELYDLLTPAERQQTGIGALPPYKVLASDGRLVHLPYDGCTAVTLLTESDRFDYYYTRRPTDRDRDRRATIPELRNGGNPFWRSVRFPIAPEAELAVRLRFWEAIGYENARWWIAWVPERGFFEIIVPVGADRARLGKFWRVAPQNFRYAVIADDGTPLQER